MIYCRKIMAIFMNKQSKIPVKRLSLFAGKCTAEIVAGGVTFWMMAALSQMLQHSLKITCASRTSKLFGILTVWSGSSISAETCRQIDCLSRSLFPALTPLPKMGGPANEGSERRNEKTSLASLFNDGRRNKGNVMQEYFLSPLYQNVFSLHGIKEGIMGVIVFSLLGGRFYCFSPSSLMAPGAFSRSELSPKADLNYASTEIRAVIKRLGELAGCHTCGQKKKGVEWIADHQPPRASVIRYNRTFFGKIRGFSRYIFYGTQYLPQQFYPQCIKCSQKQALCMRHKKSPRSVLHLRRFRPYHFTGGLIHSMRILESTHWKTLIDAHH
ncbi:hypothetical protein IE077_003342 [Cardiosporidium cionae]|uniref:Uncharacterized protein n=1 Tax=Cardiosporidium cionae TaxID=476202 RepID=A0ABQ7J8G0_9APIC|nr:hypothetical protein IE077_003342 [Cardiosporidium cionae]|eukprot:KAF8820273.1 hypothetical protein IE077_003342 [Cardiosporidium cionae]